MRSYWPLILLLAAMWGASYLFIKVAVEDIPPAAMTEFRVLAAGLLLLGYLVWRMGTSRAGAELRTAWRPCLVLGVIPRGMLRNICYIASVCGVPPAEAVAIERHPARARTIKENADTLGVPRLRIVTGEAPAALSGLAPAPTAVVVGGGIADKGVLEACWKALRKDGRMVANAVTLEAQARLTAWRARHGGDLVRISIARTEPLGGLTTLRPQLDVLQYTGRKG